MKIKEKYNLILKSVYKITTPPKDTVFSLHSIFKYYFDDGFSILELYDCAKYHHNIDYLKAEFNFGDVKVEITQNGKIYCEENLTDFTIIEGDYKFKYNKIKEKVKSFIEDPNATIESRTLINKLTDYKDDEYVKSYNNGNNEILKTVDVMLSELKLLFPDYEVLDLKLRRLRQFAVKPEKVNEIEELLDY